MDDDAAHSITRLICLGILVAGTILLDFDCIISGSTLVIVGISSLIHGIYILYKTKHKTK